MSAAQPAPRLYTVAEYFALEEQSAIRHEYYHGEVYPLDGPASAAGMTGASKAHNKLVQNCVLASRQGLRGREREVFAESVKLAVEAGAYYITRT